MKKLMALVLTFVFLASLIGCTQTPQNTPTQPSEPSNPSEPSQPESIYDYLIAEKTNNFISMLIMPATQQKATLCYPTNLLVEHIDLALLKAAEEKILAQVAQYEPVYTPAVGFVIGYDTAEGYIYLVGWSDVRYDPSISVGTICGDRIHMTFRENISGVVPFEDYPKSGQ